MIKASAVPITTVVLALMVLSACIQQGEYTPISTRLAYVINFEKQTGNFYNVRAGEEVIISAKVEDPRLSEATWTFEIEIMSSGGDTLPCSTIRSLEDKKNFKIGEELRFTPTSDGPKFISITCKPAVQETVNGVLYEGSQNFPILINRGNNLSDVAYDISFIMTDAFIQGFCRGITRSTE